MGRPLHVAADTVSPSKSGKHGRGRRRTSVVSFSTNVWMRPERCSTLRQTASAFRTNRKKRRGRRCGTPSVFCGSIGRTKTKYSLSRPPFWNLLETHLGLWGHSSTAARRALFHTQPVSILVLHSSAAGILHRERTARKANYVASDVLVVLLHLDRVSLKSSPNIINPALDPLPRLSDECYLKDRIWP